MASTQAPTQSGSSTSPDAVAAPAPLENVAQGNVAPNNGNAAPAVAPAEAPAPANLDQIHFHDHDDDEGEITESLPMATGSHREQTEDQKYVQSVRKRWRTMTDKELRETMANPLGAAELVREASRMHEEQLLIIAPYMTDAQIASTIPSLQLQFQGALVQGFSAPQVRQCVRSIPQGDRHLLLQNITLITASETDPSKDDDVQAVIGFIDPLAMAVAVERPELVNKVIKATCIMTPEQIRVMVPLLTVPQIRTVIETVVSAEGHAMVMMMLMPTQREELVAQCRTELNELEAAMKKLNADVAALSDTKLPELSRSVHAFCNKPLTSLVTREHQMLSTKLTMSKMQLEKCHREVRNLQSKMKLPLVVLNEGTTEGPLRASFMAKQEELVKLGKSVTQLYQILDNSGDSAGLIHKLYDTWSKFTAEQGHMQLNSSDGHGDTPASQEEQVYLDSDLSTALYFAVQAIGNPSAIGDIYNITWNDIIDQGFRSADDFTAKGISNLKDLETYIATNKGRASSQAKVSIPSTGEQSSAE